MATGSNRAGLSGAGFTPFLFPSLPFPSWDSCSSLLLPDCFPVASPFGSGCFSPSVTSFPERRWCFSNVGISPYDFPSTSYRLTIPDLARISNVSAMSNGRNGRMSSFSWRGRHSKRPLLSQWPHRPANTIIGYLPGFAISASCSASWRKKSGLIERIRAIRQASTAAARPSSSPPSLRPGAPAATSSARPCASCDPIGPCGMDSSPVPPCSLAG